MFLIVFNSNRQIWNPKCLNFGENFNFSHFGYFFQFLKTSKNGKNRCFNEEKCNYFPFKSLYLMIIWFGFNQTVCCMKIENMAKMIVYDAIIKHCVLNLLWKSFSKKIWSSVFANLLNVMFRHTSFYVVFELANLCTCD